MSLLFVSLWFLLGAMGAALDYRDFRRDTGWTPRTFSAGVKAALVTALTATLGPVSLLARLGSR